MSELTDMSIMIVDDTEPNVLLLERILKNAGFTDMRKFMDPREVMPSFEERRPDIICLDLQMPHLDGFQVMELVNTALTPEEYLPIIMLTADITDESKKRALSGGAKDFLTKPFNREEAVLRVKNLLETRRLHLRLQDWNRTLEVKVRERTEELYEAHKEIVQRLAVAAEHRDDDTAEHTRRVGVGAELLALELGYSSDDATLIGRAGVLHDVGKIGVSDTVLLKPKGQPFTEEDWAAMKMHPQIGKSILTGGKFRLLQLAEEISLTHHERWDGSGYPLGLVGKEIPREGQIVSVVDCFDALTHARPYKEAWPIEKALEEVRNLAGKGWDPEVVEAFLRIDHQQLI